MFLFAVALTSPPPSEGLTSTQPATSTSSISSGRVMESSKTEFRPCLFPYTTANITLVDQKEPNNERTKINGTDIAGENAQGERGRGEQIPRRASRLETRGRAARED